MKITPNIVCLGGGVGTVQILKGLRYISPHLTVVVSMADDGGSGGRLRRLFKIPPPGDLINCLNALSNTEPLLSQLLAYRFPGDRWGKDDSLSGQKMGSLMLAALTQITGNFNTALTQMQRIFNVSGQILPATNEAVSLWAKTIEGTIVKREENIDLGKYPGKREIAQIHLEPKNATTSDVVKKSILEADCILVGPGDLYTTLLPVLLVSDIYKALKETRAKRIFVVNIANKPFETPKYHLSDYLDAIKRHIGSVPLDLILMNNNHAPKIPKKLKYTYVAVDHHSANAYNTPIHEADLVNEAFPLYHDPKKVAVEFKKLL